MLDLELISTSLLISFLIFLFLFFISKSKSTFTSHSSSNSFKTPPNSYPLIGSFFAISANQHRRFQWISDVITRSPSSTFVLHRPLGGRVVFTANLSNVQHILKTHSHLYQKGDAFRTTSPTYSATASSPPTGDRWKLQRHVSSQEFNTKSFRNFVEHVVDAELNHRLIPILAAAAPNKTVLDLQDVLQRLAFDNISEIAFGYDPACLLPSLPQSKLAEAFESSVRIICGMFSATHPLIWKIKRVLNIGSEKELRIAVNEVREFAKRIVKEKKQELNSKSSLESADLGCFNLVLLARLQKFRCRN